MRTYDIPRIPNGPYNPYPAVPLQEMTLEEIKNKYIKCCAKANGDVSKCSKCQTPCTEGKRAIQLVANSGYNDPPIPLYGGKTLIERAKEENMKRRAELEKAEAEKKKAEEELKKEKAAKPKRRGRAPAMDGWYDKAYASPDPLKWIMDTFNLSKAKARQKVYAYQHIHPELRTEKPLWPADAKKVEAGRKGGMAEKVVRIENGPVIKVETPKQETKATALESYEDKISAMVKLQDEYKQKAEEFQKKADEYQKKYLELKAKVDTVFEALNILDE